MAPLDSGGIGGVPGQIRRCEYPSACTACRAARAAARRPQIAGHAVMSSCPIVDRRSSMPTTLWPSRCAVGLTQTPPSSARFALAVGITRDYYHKRRSTGKSPLPTPANRCLCLPRVGAWCGVVLVTDGAGNRQLNGAHQLRETTLGAACGPWHARERAPRRRSVSLAPTLGVDLE